MRRSHRIALVPIVAFAAACSSSNSSSTTPPAPTASAAADPAAVDSALNTVLQGLHAATSISSKAGVVGAANRLDQAATGLGAAATQITELLGVPSATKTSVVSGLRRISGLLGQASDCLHDQATARTPNPKACLGPLREAEQDDATLAKQLIDLAAFGSRSPKIFEGDLVAALRGR